ncbi:hypothetical protein [Microlunatus sp. Gsoil 973]|uniref:glycosyl hydrolase 2 galactose-binding domain-containing protein n=1 Tax=Microlunatus sp. Gsoil 973 TaxID=2672569 RepID=UPI0012B44738|nr:hypothetical protein [Microlunatus sp. Gsoil 973]QGN34064.1 hypothetical protein GJV80_15960 [Microlunatus sp. Gsoil 973]
MRSDVALTDGWQLADAADCADLTEVINGAEADGTWYDVAVPTGVHEVLLREGRIPDPHLGRNAAEADWVGEHDWVYRTRFPSPDLPSDNARLILRGVDTLAEVYLNGKRIADLDDMFVEYVLPVGEALSPAGRGERAGDRDQIRDAVRRVGGPARRLR